MSCSMRPALFLDRDGVINVDHAYVHRSDDFQFIEGIFDLVATANHVGYLVIVVTNQAGIGRGYYTEADFQQLTKWMQQQFRENDAMVDAVYFCPHHPIHGLGKYKRECYCRKPAPGMLLQAGKDHAIDLTRSIMVGDKITDMEAARRAGVGRMFYFGSETDEHKGFPVRNLQEIVGFLR